MAKLQGLGRGLDNIFEDNAAENVSGMDIVRLRVADVEPGKDQPRRHFEPEALSQLAQSIAEHGVLQPIIVRKSTLGMYEIIAGERRWRASRLAGLSEIPAIIMEADELKSAQIALIENIQRENLNPFEEASAYAELIKSYGMSQEEVASRLGKSRSAVANAVRLLELPDEVAEFVRDGRLSAGHGRTLLGLRDKSSMMPLAMKIIRRNLSVRETEAAVKRENRASQEPVASGEGVQVDYVRELEGKMTSVLGRRVKISATKAKKVVQLEFSDNDDLMEIVKALCGEIEM